MNEKSEGNQQDACRQQNDPDPAIYRKICEEYKLKHEECVFIDDNKENVAAA